jgi:hypothetical protein
MLDNLDVILSFAAVMLGVSMLVTVLTQIVSTVLNLRGVHLKQGLEQLFQEAGLDDEAKRTLARAVLKHPLLADGVFMNRLAPAVRKVELLGVIGLLQKGAEYKPIADKLERTKATVTEWFDTAMDRTSHKFTASVRIVTVVFSFLMALGIHLDSLDLLSQLSTNGDLRASLLASSDSLRRQAETVLATPPVPSPSGSAVVPASAPIGPSAGALAKEAQEIRATLDKTQFRLIPTPYPGLDFTGHLLGIIASGVLLSLGAPFWFNLLKTASRLRPILADKVDDAAAKGGS